MKKKVIVAMSGGVDSSVSALLLLQQGYDVTGVFIKTWHPDFLPCTWEDEKDDAARVALSLGIPFTVIDAEKEYKEHVANNFIEEYRIGRTPNPDVLCNKYVKYSVLKKFLTTHDYIATGHYARTETTLHTIQRGSDVKKDQSYFLWAIEKDLIPHILFPVGNYNKQDIRAIAKKHNISVADKKDSQGICFLGDVDMKFFLQQYIPSQQGNVLDTSHNIIGSHDGVWYFTIGQRHGFTTIKTSSNQKPYYVIEKNIEDNTIVVDHTLPYTKGSVELTSINEILTFPTQALAQYRYKGETTPIHITKENKGITISHNGSMASIPVGQSVVIYDKENKYMYGGGIINKHLKL